MIADARWLMGMDDRRLALPCLTVQTGPEAGRRIPLTTGARTVLGRALDADLTFPDEPSLSRHHARIDRADGRYMITDLDSSNGTRLNGLPITEPAALSDGDVLACGSLQLLFESPGRWGQGQDGDGDGGADARAPAVASPRIRAAIASETRPALTAQQVRPEAVPLLVAGAAPPINVRDEGGAADEVTPGAGEATAPGGAAPSGDTGGEGGEAPPPDRDEPAPSEDAAPMPVPAVSPLVDALAAMPLFCRLNAGQLVAMVQMMTQRRFPAGAVIVRQGEEGLSLYVVLEGTVRVQRTTVTGEAVDLGAIEPRGFFGEMTLLDGLPRSATVTAVTAVRCALLPRWGLEDVIRAHPSVAIEMLNVLSRRLRATEPLITA